MAKKPLAPPIGASRRSPPAASPASTAPALAEFCDTASASKIVGISVSTLMKLRMRGDGPPYIKFSKLVRYHIPELRAWMAEHEHRSTSEYGRVA